MTIRSAVLGAVLVALAGAAATHAQQATIRPSPEAPVQPRPRSADEQDAYFTVQNAATAVDRLRAVNDFLADYIDSEYRHLVLFQEWRARGELQHDAEDIIDVALRAIEAQDHFLTTKLTFVDDPSGIADLPEVRFTLVNREALFYQSVVESYLAEGDGDSVAEYAELALASQAEALELFEAVGEPGTPTYDQTVEQIRGGQLFVLNTLLDRAVEADDFANVAAYGDRILEVAPDDVFVLRTLMQGYLDAGDTDAAIRYGAGLLEASPDDLNTLMTLSRIMSEEAPDAAPAGHWEQAQEYAARASAQLDVFLAGPDAAQLTDEQRTAFVTEVNTTLGFASIQTEAFADAAAALDRALGATPRDANLYQLRAVAAQGARDLDGMMSALARAVFLEHPDAQLRASLGAIYEAVNGSADGLDAFIEREGEQIAD